MKFLKKIINRFTFVTLAILIQLIWIIVGAAYLSNYYYYLSYVFSALSLVVVIFIISKDADPGIKLAWVVPILIFPLFGWIIYILFGTRLPSNRMRKRFADSDRSTVRKLPTHPEVLNEICAIDQYVGCQMRYPADHNYPAYKNSSVKYYPSGEEWFADLMSDIRSAEKFIFLEYFIISEGEMWAEIEKALVEKVGQGVDVRVVYDDFGSINYLPSKYHRILESRGIKCVAFNRYKPFLSVVQHNRDHRKIAVIDGKSGYTGGANISDEYINLKVRFGYWKDAAIRIEGDAVDTLTAIFLEMWNCNRKENEGDISDFIAQAQYAAGGSGGGYVQPFGDSPLDGETLSENIYLNMISHAKKYVYIFTPYVATDNLMSEALILAVKRGVDVRMVIPEIPDKKIVYQLTKSHCYYLSKGGVRIYSYTPGFLHSKCIICDDEIAAVGTVNLDYRSLRHHFECGCILYKCPAIADIYDDFVKTFYISKHARLSKRRVGLIRSFFFTLLRLFSPLF